VTSSRANDIQERYLRIVTNSPSYTYSPGSPYPGHPSTGKGWKSRNLKCTTCVDWCCAVCGRACCAFKAAVMALETHKENPVGRQNVVEKIQEITELFPYGKEIPTFVQCTSGGGGGCGKLVCPDCSGICPTPACRDTQCRRCKEDPWAACPWHGSHNSPSIISSRNHEGDQ